MHMEDPYILEMDGDPIRFTPDGRVYVLDAIEAVSGSDAAHRIWKSLQRDHPEILDLCQHRSLPGETGVIVADTEGWDRILLLLLEYLPFLDA